MCVTAILVELFLFLRYVSASRKAILIVVDTLSGTGQMTPGWMGVGFGSQMANSPIVILWSNSDGSITLSQRQAPSEVMPTVVTNPPRTTSGNIPQFVFSIPSTNSTTVPTIWAFGPQNPGSSSTNAALQIHEETGITSFDLSKDFTSIASSSSALMPFQRLVIAHAIMLTIGFLLLLPIGAPLARYMRRFTPIWFKGHWIVQFAVSGPIIVIGIALGIQAVVESGAQHLNDEHNKWGIALFILYLLQCSLGAFIHWVKFKHILGRPPQNYIHALLGLFIIGAALYQVRTRYKTEWSKIGRGPLMAGTDYIWYIWVVMLPLLYTLGLSFLPKQFNQENRNKNKKEKDEEMFEVATVFDEERQEREMGIPNSENIAEEHDAMKVGEASPTVSYRD
ncbi:hypothetical protein J3R30DRAFT_3288932 [Lentinula aciculospora]|uniref:Cytochrome b561 domain-containing protein n=1 Tax=Lentinula aciculospora TaxID=153920 RepID=A0A9W9DNI4_9AGAR|nr:hypothetical protein J3R30DRAFT_3288932 [Lentinula aciculospora]